MGTPGKHPGPAEESRHSPVEGCILILCRGGSVSMGSGAFCLQLGCWAVSRPVGLGRASARLSAYAQQGSASFHRPTAHTSPKSSHCHRHTALVFPGLMGPRWPLTAVTPCTSLLAHPHAFETCCLLLFPE